MGKCAYEVNLQDVQRDLITIAKEAGKTILSARYASNLNYHNDGSNNTTTTTTTNPDTKKNAIDLVTETDKAVEKQISKYLCIKYPSFQFLGEETYKPGMTLTEAPTFVVDPIDGTTNFVHGHPWVAVSLGFAVCREARVGVVFAPFLGIMYTAVKGRGAFRKEFDFDQDEMEWKIRTAAAKLPLGDPSPFNDGLVGAVVIVEWGTDRAGANWACKIQTWDKLGRAKEDGGAMVRSGRSYGSAALNLCTVAEGSNDVYWEGGCWAWDVCAGWVVLTEAGGIIVDGNPGSWEIPIDHRKYLAVRGAPAGQKDLVDEFWGYVVGTMDYES